MATRKELLETIETRSKALIGTRFRYNILNVFIGYRQWNKAQMEEFITLYLS
jgi:hypothetical protein